MNQGAVVTMCDPGVVKSGRVCVCETPQKCTVKWTTTVRFYTQGDDREGTWLHTVKTGKGLVKIEDLPDRN